MRSKYEVVIRAAPFTGGEPNNGFIDIRQYTQMADGKHPATLAISEAKVRGHFRYEMMIMQLHRMTNIYIDRPTFTGSDSSKSPTSVTLIMDVEHGDGALMTEDEDNQGAHLFGRDAIVRCIARAFTTSATILANYFDPTEIETINNGSTISVPRGFVTQELVIGALADNFALVAGAIDINKIG